ncbi:MAG TPA: hypothetical protein VL793_06530, partial [Patescibacteria group bacterium]|nr:hypothetical protein [Patescibacteria group bacterium]
MVAHSKRHKKAREKQTNHHSRKPQLGRLNGPAPLPPARSPVHEPELAKEDEEPKPEDLAKEEEALKAEETAVAAAAEAEEPAGTRTRERTSYDGDTAIKLYLREIGQEKLLTP